MFSTDTVNSLDSSTKQCTPAQGNFFSFFCSYYLPCKVQIFAHSAVTGLRCLVLWQGSRRVAALAFLGRVLVEEDVFSLKFPVVLMAARARHVLMQALQCKLRPFVVIKLCRFPLCAVMTIDARRHAILLKLFAVGILVAPFALDGCRREIRLDQLGLHIGRLVAIDARGGLVRSGQGKRGLAVIELLDILPILGGMAAFATSRGSVGAKLLHALGKLRFVRILVAGLAVQVLPMVEHHRLRLCFRMLRLFVAIAAGDGHVAPGQNKAGVLVSLQREGGGLETLHRMAFLALVQIRGCGELAIVPILVAVGTFLELNLVERVLPFGNVALGARHSEVLAVQRIVARRMVFGRKC